MKRNGYSVCSAYEVNMAWDALDENRPQLIISDIMMPRIDGFEFVRMLREEDSRIPILFISARDDIEAKKEGLWGRN